MAFCRRWRALGERVWLVPTSTSTTTGFDGTVFRGNYRRFMEGQRWRGQDEPGASS